MPLREAGRKADIQSREPLIHTACMYCLQWQNHVKGLIYIGKPISIILRGILL